MGWPTGSEVARPMINAAMMRGNSFHAKVFGNRTQVQFAYLNVGRLALMIHRTNEQYGLLPVFLGRFD